MNSTEYIAIGSLIIALVSLITGFILQREQKEIRELKKTNKKYKSKLLKALNAIQGYQNIEKDKANELGKEPSTYRREIRKNYSQYFDTDFLTPKNIETLINELENK